MLGRTRSMRSRRKTRLPLPRPVLHGSIAGIADAGKLQKNSKAPTTHACSRPQEQASQSSGQKRLKDCKSSQSSDLCLCALQVSLFLSLAVSSPGQAPAISGDGPGAEQDSTNCLGSVTVTCLKDFC